MAVEFTCKCQTCGVVIPHEESAYDHLALFPTHIIIEVFHDSEAYEDPQDIAEAEGNTRIYDNELYTYDDTRERWLSVNRVTVCWGANKNTRSVWLSLFTQLAANSETGGYLIMKDAVLTKVAATRQDGNKAWIIRLCTNYDLNNEIAYMSIDEDDDYAYYLGSNSRVWPYNTLHCYLEVPNNKKVNRPFVQAEFAWVIPE
jgi:hypothetical protein